MCSEMGDMYRAMRDEKKRLRAKHGVDCPECKKLRPKAFPSVLLPQQKCRVDGYRDPRPRLTPEEESSV